MASAVSLLNISSPPLKWSAAVETLENKSTSSSDDRQTVTLSLLEKKKDKYSDATNQNPDSKNGNEAVLLNGNDEKKKRRTFSAFSVSLTREKIEADLIEMGGSKRSRRAKKRPKNVQKQLDDLFPGLRLKYITTDDYRVRAP